MKSRLNITIDNELLSAAKSYAGKRKTSLSEMIEDYLKIVTKPAKQKNIISLVDKLKKPVIKKDADLKELFYKDQAKKYGF